jgi:hypothetical protein
VLEIPGNDDHELLVRVFADNLDKMLRGCLKNLANNDVMIEVNSSLLEIIALSYFKMVINIHVLDISATLY